MVCGDKAAQQYRCLSNRVFTAAVPVPCTVTNENQAAQGPLIVGDKSSKNAKSSGQRGFSITIIFFFMLLCSVIYFFKIYEMYIVLI